MGKNKLRKFAEMETLPMVFQYPFARLAQEPFPLKGRWHEFFGNHNPIVLELGCGKGEYATSLAQSDPGQNYIGIDIKGARMWTGATTAQNLGLPNVAFLRTSIELLEHFFAPGEVASLWITFPAPQMKKARKRLTGTRMLELYRKVLVPGGLVRLKTDSPFLYAYTGLMARHNGLDVTRCTDDLHGAGAKVLPDSERNIHTHYENQWIARGLSIKYLEFRLTEGPLEEPPGAEDIPEDTYRSYSRGYIQMPQLMGETQDSEQ